MISREAFVLEWDFSLLDSLPEIESYVWLERFPGQEKFVRLASTAAADVPEPVEFEAIFQYLEKTSDYPPNNVNWPLMSRQMIDVIIVVEDFPHRQINVLLHDVLLDTLTPEGKRRRTGKKSEDYVAVQLLTHLDAMDMDKSVYTIFPQWPDEVEWIDKLVLKAPAEGYPPLFRLSAKPIPLFVSSDARIALEEAEIKGVTFQEVEEFRL